MRGIIFCSVALFGTLPGMAQQPAATAVPVSPVQGNRRVIPVVPPPVSARPSPHARLSTAQGAAARVNLPALQVLPEFGLIDRDGSPRSSQGLVQKSHWLLIYRRANCVACDRLMNVLVAGTSVQPGLGQAYAVVVAGKEPGGLDRVRAAYSALSEAAWMGDPNDEAMTALKAKGAPMLYGMDGSKIMWTIPGNLGNPALVERMASQWVADSIHSSAGAVRAK